VPSIKGFVSRWGDRDAAFGGGGQYNQPFNPDIGTRFRL
jgi:hypothetical protein